MTGNIFTAWICVGLSGAIVALLIGRLLAVHLKRRVPFHASRSRLEQLGYDALSLTTWVWALLLVVVALATWGVIASPLHVIVAGLAALAVGSIGFGLRLLIERRELTLRRQICEAASAIAGSLSAGTAPAMAWEAAARQAPRPLQEILLRVSADYRRGVPLPQALQITERVIAIESFSLISAAITFGLQRGGRLTEALARIAEGLYQQQALDDKLAALTASGRKAIVTMSVFPILFATMFYWIDPYGYDLILSTTGGQYLAVLTVATAVIAVRWAKSILDQVV